LVLLPGNSSLGFTTEARACKVAGQEKSLRVTPHAPENVGKCERMNPHTPKGASTLGVGWNPDGVPNFQKVITGVKTEWIEEFLISLKIS